MFKELIHIGDFHQMTNCVDHTQYLRGSLEGDGVVQFLETQCIEGLLLASRTIDAAFHLLNLYLSHNYQTNY